MLDEEIRGSWPRPLGRTVFIATPMAGDLRTRRNESLLFVRSLDPNFNGFPLHLDCPTYGGLGFRVILRRAGSLILETTDSITLQWQGSQSVNVATEIAVGVEPGCRCTTFRERRVVAAMDKKGGIGQSITSIGWRHQWIAGSHGQVHMGWATIFVPKVLSRKWADPSSWFARILLQRMNDLELDGMKLSYK